jgi:catechol 2,3-dioxygenase-like lactoylglutathione lyase family enzyme
MGYRLAMSAEIYDWLADLRRSDSPAARLAAQALAALADGGDGLGPPLVTAVDGRLQLDELGPALDGRYQALLEAMTAKRREVAEAATRRKHLELQAAGRQAPAGLPEQLAAAVAEEQRLTAASQREQLRTDAFRTRREVLKAALVAAQAGQLIDPVGAAVRFDEIASQIEQELDLGAVAGGLMELRPGAPADDSIRILFGVEPPGTALLIAVLEGPEAVRDHYREAILLASEVLQDARAGDAEAAAHTFANAPSFLAEFFPLRTRSGRLHHVELWVPDLARAVAEWGWLLTSLGYEQFQDWEAGRSWNLDGTYLVVEQSPAMSSPEHDRLRPGLNHLAFHAGPRAQVDRLTAAAPEHGWTLLFPDRHPHAGGPAHYAAYLTNTDGYEVELVADDPGEP